jgi:hypothetical protein
MKPKLLTRTTCVICHKPMLAGEHALDAYPYRIAQKIIGRGPKNKAIFEPNWCCEKCWEKRLTAQQKLRSDAKS